MSSIRLMVVALVVGGCIRPNLETCGSLLCPENKICADDQCVSQDQIDACDGLADGVPCTPVTSAPGTCLDGACVQFCGDGVVESGEQCDDGNQNPADGCNACALTTWTATAVVGGNAGGTTVTLPDPTQIALDRHGNLFIADATANRVWRLDATGVITPVAGNGTNGFSGDGGAATSAQLGQPWGVAVDGLGQIYIADMNNARVRRVDLEGTITTVAGNGNQAYAGDDGLATSASLYVPEAVAVDGLGNLYIAEPIDNRIRFVDATTGVISTVVGNGTAGDTGDNGRAVAAEISFPLGMAFDSVGDLYFADRGNESVRRVDVNGTITTVAGTGGPVDTGDGGLATAAGLGGPQGVAVDDQGALYIADSTGSTVRRVDPITKKISTVAGNGTAGFSGDGGGGTSAMLDLPYGVAAWSGGNIFICDTANNRIREVDASSVISTVAGTGDYQARGDGGAATGAPLSKPYGVAADATGTIYIADTNNNRIQRVDASGVITAIAGTGIAGFSGDGGPAISAAVSAPNAVATDGAGNIYIADSGNNRVRRIDSAGVITTFAGTGTSGDTGDNGPATSAELATPLGLAFTGGNLYIVDQGRLRRVDSTGKITTLAGTGTNGFSGDNGPSTSAQLYAPHGVAVDGLGNIYIADTDNNRIRKIDSGGTITTFAGSGMFSATGDGGRAIDAGLNNPYSVGADATGNVYIADTFNNEIRRVDTGGTITRFAGSLTAAQFQGDGGPANAAGLANPYGVAADGAGNVEIADTQNNLVRRVDSNGVIVTAAGQVDPPGTGPVALAHLADPRALVVDPTLTFVAGGNSDTVEGIFAQAAIVEVVAGFYPQTIATANVARFRDNTFGSVGGVAYDATTGSVYLTETAMNRVDVVTIVDPMNPDTWTIATFANASSAPGFADGAAQTALFRGPTGLYLEGGTLYVADTGNHVIRAIDLASRSVRSVIGTPATVGYFGDGGPATAALLYAPQAFTKCSNGDLFVADTGNNRVRRIDATGTISTVLGDGTPASSGEGLPAATFPVDTPRGLACDALGNLYVTSTTTVREVSANEAGTVDGTGPVFTIYGGSPRVTFPASVTTCLTGIAVVDATDVQVTDSCTGLLVNLARD